MSAMRAVSWFEFIDFRRDIVVGNLFAVTNSCAEPRRKSRSAVSISPATNLPALRP
jgi:hypothetical protein